MAIKALLFDLDNTLIDFMRMKRGSCEAAIEAMIGAGVKLDKERAMDVLFDLYGEYGIEYDRIFQKFLEKINKKVDYKILAAGIIAYRKAQEGLCNPYPNVIPTLIKLRERGLKLAVVTDAPTMKAWMRLTELRLQDLFDVVVSFDDTGERKPSALPFKKALKELTLEPHEVLMTGDWPERDIVGAKGLGIKTCWARYGWAFKKDPPKQSGADYEIDSIAELLGVVDEELRA